MANTIKFDYDNNLILDKVIEQPLIVGQSNFYNFIVEFYSRGNLMWDDTWKAVVIFERPDGERSNELLLTRSGPFYEKKMAAWVSDVEGDLKVTVRIKTENNDVIQAFPLVIFEVEEGLKPSGDTIEEAQYQGILDDINRVNNSIEDHIMDVGNPHEINEKIADYTYDKETIDDKVDKVAGKGLSTNDYTTAEKDKLEGIEAGAEKNPYTKTQLDTMFGDKTNEADFLVYQTTVQNFLNGKLDKKPDGTVDLITALNKIDVRYLDIDNELFIIVASLPTTGVANKIYLVPKSGGAGSNIYDEYVWLSNKWEQFGTITVDLSNYYNKTEINNLLTPKITKAQGDTYYVPLARTINSKALSANIVLNATDVGLSNVPNVDTTNPANITQSATYRFVSDTEKSIWNNKQNKLTAGDNITIVDNVISSTGGGEVPAYSSMTQADINTGTSTTSMVISPKLFKDNVKSMIDNAIIAGINGGY